MTLERRCERVGKYAHLVVAVDGVTINSPQYELLVNFGAVPVGQSVEKWIEILNMSPVKKLRFRDLLCPRP